MQNAFQDQMPDNDCWGCGPNNEQGLKLKSFWDKENDNQTKSIWNPSPYHKAGPDQYLNGGIISTIIDCHGICSAIAFTSKADNIEIANLWYVTGSLKILFKKPTPIDSPVELIATLVEKYPKKSIINCSVYSNGSLTVEGEVIAIRVSSEWTNKSTQHI